MGKRQCHAQWASRPTGPRQQTWQAYTSLAESCATFIQLSMGNPSVLLLSSLKSPGNVVHTHSFPSVRRSTSTKADVWSFQKAADVSTWIGQLARHASTHCGPGQNGGWVGLWAKAEKSLSTLSTGVGG